LNLPYERWLNMPFRRVGVGGPEDKSEMTTLCYVTPEYFRTLRIPLLRGRVFADGDRPQSKLVAVVNESFVQEYLCGQETLGSHIAFRFRIDREPREIVGVVGDVQQRPSFGDYGPIGRLPSVYVPAAQVSDEFVQLVHTWFSPSWVVRTSAPQAGLALLLAAVGIYGLTANSVAERTREMGIRMALGANAGRAVWTVAMPGILLAVAGVAVGCLLACGTAQVLQHLVWGVSPTDPVSFVVAALALVSVAAAGSILPALRLARVNPAETLREE
ncbi:MAG: ABC transporter permease, partial [Acidobacteria bacterium]|nr:ABC transporter permease [Acidobacteriota bacterium]